jgi:hypothetical protein
MLVCSASEVTPEPILQHSRLQGKELNLMLLYYMP